MVHNKYSSWMIEMKKNLMCFIWWKHIV